MKCERCYKGFPDAEVIYLERKIPKELYEKMEAGNIRGEMGIALINKRRVAVALLRTGDGDKPPRFQFSLCSKSCEAKLAMALDEEPTLVIFQLPQLEPTKYQLTAMVERLYQ